jgi:predicted PilT family ATPase
MNGTQRITKALSVGGFSPTLLEYERPCGYIEMAGPDGGWYVEAEKDGEFYVFSDLRLADVLKNIENSQAFIN